MNWLLIGWTDAFGPLQKHFASRRINLENCSTQFFLNEAGLTEYSNLVIASSFMHYSAEERTHYMKTFRNQLVRHLDSLRNPNVIYLSSAAVYGLSATKAPCAEGQPVAPQSDYGKEKASFEKFIASETDKRDGRCVIFRPAGFFGKRGVMKRANSLIDRLEEAAVGKKSERFDVESNGEQLRDFLHVDDLFQVIAKTAKQIDLFVGQSTPSVFNVSNGQTHSVKSVVEQFRRNNEEIEAIYRAKTTNEINCVLDTHKISKFFDLSSFRSVFSGLQDCPK